MISTNKIVVKLDRGNSEVLQSAIKHGWILDQGNSGLNNGIVSMSRKNRYGEIEYGVYDYRSVPNTFSVSKTVQFEISNDFNDLDEIFN